MNDWLEVNLIFPFIYADTLSVELTSIDRALDILLKSSSKEKILKSDGADISVILISYPSSDSIINWSKSDVFIAFNPVWDEYWLITFAKAEISFASIVALIDKGSLFFPVNLKFISPLVPLLNGPRRILVFALTEIPVPDKSVESFSAKYFAEALIGTSVEFILLLAFVVWRL